MKHRISSFGSFNFFLYRRICRWYRGIHFGQVSHLPGGYMMLFFSHIVVLYVFPVLSQYKVDSVAK